MTKITKKTKKCKGREFKMIDIELRNEMVRFIRDRIICNLEATKQFLELKEDYDDICAGIYTYAVEEYGKILFLNGLSPEPPDNKIKVDMYGNHGFRDHKHKFDLALKDKDKVLSDSCKTLRRGDFVGDDFERKDFVMDTPADMTSRMAVFYADFKDEHSIWKPLEVDRDLLVKAVDDFLAFMKGKKYPC